MNSQNIRNSHTQISKQNTLPLFHILAPIWIIFTFPLPLLPMNMLSGYHGKPSLGYKDKDDPWRFSFKFCFTEDVKVRIKWRNSGSYLPTSFSLPVFPRDISNMETPVFADIISYSSCKIHFFHTPAYLIWPLWHKSETAFLHGLGS